jgi:hypothetical protein
MFYANIVILVLNFVFFYLVSRYLAKNSNFLEKEEIENLFVESYVKSVNFTKETNTVMIELMEALESDIVELIENNNKRVRRDKFFEEKLREAWVISTALKKALTEKKDSLEKDKEDTQSDHFEVSPDIIKLLEDIEKDAGDA